MSEDTWDEIREAHDKAEWASLLELCALHLKGVPAHRRPGFPKRSLLGI
jgi:hypothetical protein